MYGTEQVHLIYKVVLVLLLLGFYTQLMYGWGERIEWLQSLSPSEYLFRP